MKDNKKLRIFQDKQQKLIHRNELNCKITLNKKWKSQKYKQKHLCNAESEALKSLIFTKKEKKIYCTSKHRIPESNASLQKNLTDPTESVMSTEN
jgi:hypothetical protein